MSCPPTGPVDVVAGPGFLGGAVAALLAAAGRPVVCLARAECAVSDGRGGALPVVPCDISDPSSVRRAADVIGAPVRLLVQCASSKGGGVEDYQKVYLHGARNVIGQLRPALLVFAGSTSVYGQTDGSWVTEQSPASPGTERGEILLAAEREVLGAGGIVARLAGLYGPGRSVHLAKMREGRAVIEEDGARWINQIHRDDAASALVHLSGIAEPPRVVNVSDGSPLTQRELYSLIARHCGLPLPPHGPPAPRKRGSSSKRVSNGLLVSTGWRPRFASYADFLAAGAGEPGAL